MNTQTKTKCEWIMPGIIAILESGSQEAKKQVSLELMEMAKKIDAYDARGAKKVKPAKTHDTRTELLKIFHGRLDVETDGDLMRRIEFSISQAEHNG